MCKDFKFERLFKMAAVRQHRTGVFPIFCVVIIRKSSKCCKIQMTKPVALLQTFGSVV